MIMFIFGLLAGLAIALILFILIMVKFSRGLFG
jgi:hypothetical protein